MPRELFVAPAEPGLCRRARALAAELGLPCRNAAPETTTGPTATVLLQEADGLALAPGGPKAPGPLRLDLLRGAVAHRARTATAGQPLARALGLGGRSAAAPVILDATAGLGRDAFVLAVLGARVVAVERHPALFALLRDARRRAAAAEGPLARAARERLRPVYADATALLGAPGRGEAAAAGADGAAAWPRPSAIYLDPMYPPKRKASARPRKEMAVLQALAGLAPDPDADRALLAAARQSGAGRVVVKRPRRASPLAPPTGEILSKLVRFDLYVD